MEAMSISERVERLEVLHGIAGPAICPDPTGEGSAWQGSPIPANEGDSQKAGLSDKIAESVVQDLQQACYDRDELRATVERLKAENAALVARNDDLVKSRNQYRKELEELEEKMDAIKELAG